MNKIIMGLLIVLSGCSATKPEPAPFTPEEFSERKQLSLQQAKSPEAKEYFSAMAKHWNKFFLDAVNNCSSKSSRGVELLLTVDEQGQVTEVIGRPWNSKSKCFAKAYKGLSVIRPPVNPFYISYEMG